MYLGWMDGRMKEITSQDKDHLPIDQVALGA
jgi:hypothetical protein